RLVAGRFLDALDMSERRKVAVIGPRVQEILFARGEDPLGGHIRINGADFKVIGTFKPPRSGDSRDDQAQSLFVPFTTFQSTFNYGNRVGWFAITSKPGVPASVVETKVVALLKERHGVAPADERAIGHFNLEKEFGQVEGLFGGIETLIWIVGIGTLAAGVIGVSNIMLVIVRERTHEIGVRRAVGATPFAIMTQVVLEALVLTGIAGSFGLMAGVGVVELTARLTSGASLEMFRNPEVDLATALQTLAILVVSGILAGIFPARRAVSASPVEALRAVI
ncbi:MAG TPA: ABC transporter permease, partial [Verrucomicrobiae bacterium]|nr:ABC transporter permease [Verrucomicrobiae bacterium]